MTCFFQWFVIWALFETKIKTEINLFLDKESKRIGKGFIIGGESVLEITIGGQDFIDAMLKVTERILDQTAPHLKKYNNKTNMFSILTIKQFIHC